MQSTTTPAADYRSRAVLSATLQGVVVRCVFIRLLRTTGPRSTSDRDWFRSRNFPRAIRSRSNRRSETAGRARELLAF